MGNSKRCYRDVPVIKRKYYGYLIEGVREKYRRRSTSNHNEPEKLGKGENKGIRSPQKIRGGKMMKMLGLDVEHKRPPQQLLKES